MPLGMMRPNSITGSNDFRLAKSNSDRSPFKHVTPDAVYAPECHQMGMGGVHP